MAGLLTDSFAEAAQKVLPRLSGLRCGESTVQRATEDAGARVGGWLEQGCTFGEASSCWLWHKDKLGRRGAHVGGRGPGGGPPTPGRGPPHRRNAHDAQAY